jgi:hypothetical protein
MRNAVRIAAVSFVVALVLLSGATAGQHWEQLVVVLKVGDRSWKYNNAQLRAMATDVFTSARGVKKNPAIRLDLFVTKDTKLPMDQIIGVVVIGAEKVLFLEGANLAHLKHLGLKFGDNHLTLVPLTEEAETALRPVWGKPRIEDVERVDVLHAYEK